MNAGDDVAALPAAPRGRTGCRRLRSRASVAFGAGAGRRCCGRRRGRGGRRGGGGRGRLRLRGLRDDRGGRGHEQDRGQRGQTGRLQHGVSRQMVVRDQEGIDRARHGRRPTPAQATMAAHPAATFVGAGPCPVQGADANGVQAKMQNRSSFEPPNVRGFANDRAARIALRVYAGAAATRVVPGARSAQSAFSLWAGSQNNDPASVTGPTVEQKSLLLCPCWTRAVQP